MSTLWQFWQVGVSAFPILWRCACNGMCPVCICMRSDTCHHFRFCVTFLKFEEGMVGSICQSNWHLGDCSNHFFALVHISFLWAWHAADQLSGRSCLQSLCSSCWALDLPRATCLASSSACSFPIIPSWPGVHFNLILMPGCLCQMATSCSWKVSAKYCPGVPLLFMTACIAAWLSAPIVAVCMCLSAFISSVAN